MGYFSLFVMVFITLNLIVSKKISEIYNFTVFVLYCLIVTKPFSKNLNCNFFKTDMNILI